MIIANTFMIPVKVNHKFDLGFILEAPDRRTLTVNLELILWYITDDFHSRD